MKESEFIDINKDKWSAYENHIAEKNSDPDVLRDVFIQVTDDLSYSRANYPNRSVRVYLNYLARKFFDKLGKRKKIELQPIVNFYTIEAPQIMFLARKEMLISLIVLLLSVGIGIYSYRQDPAFAEQILGESYVKMTQKNIQSGDPMAVYRHGKEVDGFLSILYNNARIDILILALGMLFGVGALLVLVQNGIMLGVFQYFFYANGGFEESVLTIWLHGTIEISTLALMGGVGLVAGKGLLFPGTYTRYQSFRLSAGNAAKLLLTVLPFTLVAAIIEGFVTRQTGAPDLIKIIFILLSMLFVVFYFVLLPIRINRTIGVNPVHEKLRNPEDEKVVEPNVSKSVGQIISDAFVLYKKQLGKFLGLGFGAAAVLAFCSFLFFPEMFDVPEWSFLQQVQINLLDISDLGTYPMPNDEGVSNFNIFLTLLSTIVFVTYFFLTYNHLSSKSFKMKMLFTKQGLIVISFLLISSAVFHWEDRSVFVSALTLFSISYLLILIMSFCFQMDNKERHKNLVKQMFVRPIQHLVVFLALSAIVSFIMFLLNSTLMVFFESFFADLIPFGLTAALNVLTGIEITLYYGIFFSCVPLIFSTLFLHVSALSEDVNAFSLSQKLKAINLSSL